VLWAYLDESGTHKGARVLSVAGYVGTKKEWNLFEKNWSGCLAGTGIEYFHANSPKCDFLRPDLALSITKRNLRGMLCAIDPEIYNKQTSHQFKSTLGNAYAICTFSCALSIVTYAQQNNLGRVTFVIEAGQPNAEFIERMLKSMMADDEHKIAGVMLANKKDFVPLQTADFLSHVFSTNGDNEKAWFEYLVKFGKINWVMIPLQGVRDIELSIKEMHSKKRHLKCKARQSLKANQS
jgi:Protein of unknown function (DUF3800)